MKVYVMTQAVPFGPEEFVSVKATYKEALNHFRHLYPHMKGESKNNSGKGCVSFVSDAEGRFLLFIREKEV